MLDTQESKQQALAKLEKLVDNGRAHAQQVIDHVLAHQPADRIIRGGELKFKPGDKAVTLSPDSDQTIKPQTVHKHAIHQMAAVTDMPVKFITSLEDTEWGRGLLALNLETVFNRRFERKRYLLRSLNSEVRGFLSDAYRRIDSRPVVEAFATAAQQKGAVPYEGYVTDTKIALQAIMPEVFEPIPGEMVAYGLSLENSDYGNGALSLRAYLLRIWCKNLAITSETMRQVHLGKRLDDSIRYSNRTYELDSKATVSAMRDVIGRQLNSAQLHEHMALIRRAAEQTVDPDKARVLLKKALTETETNEVQEAYTSLDTENMPPGNNVWRLSNAISWVAGKVKDAERRLELSKLAGSVLNSKN